MREITSPLFQLSLTWGTLQFSWGESFIFSAVFCRSVDADPRKQGMSGGSVPAHMTDANDAADEGGAPKITKTAKRVSGSVAFNPVTTDRT
jgi:hypothetical protein